MEEYILAIDAGTTSSRALVFNQKGETMGMAQHEFTQHFPKESWVEHDAEEIWTTQLKAIREAIESAGIQPQQIKGMGITNQRETTVLWNRKTGKPVHRARCKKTYTISITKKTIYTSTTCIWWWSPNW